MRKDIKFSVIVIGYNIEKYVNRCLDSICNQKFDDYEIIFVDDGSSDNTYSIAKKYEERGVLCYTKSNGGIISARKYGIEKCLGEYVIFIDGDDFIAEDMLSNFYNDINSTDVDIVMTDSWYQEKDGKFCIRRSKADYGIYDGYSYFENIMSDNLLHHISPKAYKKELFDKIHYLDFPEITVAEDLLLNACLGLEKPVVLYSDKSVNYNYCYNSESTSRAESDLIFQQIQVLDYIEKQLKNMDLLLQYKDLVQYSWMSYAFTYVGREFSPDFKKKLMNNCKLHLYEYKKNEICKKGYCSYSVLFRLAFNVYWKTPFLGWAVDPVINLIRNTRNKIRKKLQKG